MTIWYICHMLNVGNKLEITMDKFEVEFYTKDNGEKPAKDFIPGLDAKMRAKVGTDITKSYSKRTC